MAVDMVIALLQRELDDATQMVSYYALANGGPAQQARKRYAEYAHQLTATIKVLRSLAGEKLLDATEAK